jgi:hypothetical protein
MLSQVQPLLEGSFSPSSSFQEAKASVLLKPQLLVLVPKQQE